MLRIIDGGLAALPATRCSVREQQQRRYPSDRSEPSDGPGSSDEPMLLGAVREHVERLRLVQSVVTLSVMALRRQDAERDEEIASVLDQHAAARLSDEVCELEEILERVEEHRAVRPMESERAG